MSTTLVAWYRQPRWWLIAAIAVLALATLDRGHERPAPTSAGVMPSTPAPAEDRSLNLFWHYEHDLRWVLSGSAIKGCATRLAKDVGCARVEQAQYHFFITKRIADGVGALGQALHLTEAERQAWILMIPLLMADEERPSWQKAGVRR